MSQNKDILITALAPIMWGTTYLVTTEFLPDGYPITVAMLRTLPAGLLLVLLVRQLPKGAAWGKVFLLGGLNFTIFQSLLFVAAYRLPGGVAATVGAVQPLFVIFLAGAALGTRILPLSVLAALLGASGVALLLLSPGAAWDPVGIGAALLGAACMAFGTVYSRKWQGDVAPLNFTAWQLSAGGLLLLPLSIIVEPPLPELSGDALLGLGYLGLFGGIVTYALWFRGISKLEPSVVSSLGFLSPLTAVFIGWLVLGQSLSLQASFGIVVTMVGVWLSQNSARLTKQFAHS